MTEKFKMTARHDSVNLNGNEKKLWVGSFLGDFPLTKYLFFKNTGKTRRFSSNEVQIFSKIQAKLGHFPLRKSSFSYYFSGIQTFLGDFPLTKSNS
jgi:hypothetical protein